MSKGKIQNLKNTLQAYKKRLTFYLSPRDRENTEKAIFKLTLYLQSIERGKS